MELLTACALGTVAYCAYLTMKDMLEDLYRERLRPIPVTVREQAARHRYYQGRLR